MIKGRNYLRPLWAEVNLDYLADNVGRVRRFIGPDVKLLAVVKGDAYGTGIAGIIETLLAAVDMLGRAYRMKRCCCGGLVSACQYLFSAILL